MDEDNHTSSLRSLGKSGCSYEDPNIWSGQKTRPTELLATTMKHYSNRDRGTCKNKHRCYFCPSPGPSPSPCPVGYCISDVRYRFQKYWCHFVSNGAPYKYTLKAGGLSI